MTGSIRFTAPAVRVLAVLMVTLALLAPSLPWIWQAWRVSPLDAWGWVFLLLGVLWGFLVVDLGLPDAPAVARSPMVRGLDHAGWPALAGFVALGVAGVLLDVRVVMAGAALGIGWGLAWLLLGGRLALLLLPALVLGWLALPTTGYLSQQAWVSLSRLISPALGVGLGPAGVLLLKAGVALLALLLGLLLGWLARRGSLPVPRIAASAYVIALGAALLGLLVASHPPALGPSVALAEDRMAFGPWLGAEIPVSPAEQRLFGASRRLSKRLYGSRDGERVSVLLVESNDVHDLHTPEYCLGGSGWRLSRDEPLRPEDDLAFGGVAPAASVLAAARGAQRLAGVYWFASAVRSTDDLASLRLQRRLAADKNWRMILVTAIGDARQPPEPVLRRFVREAPWTPYTRP